jgi:hypothetical protein
MNQDEIQIEILPDGSLKIETDEVSAANHMSADDLVKFIERLAGGETQVKHKHTHAHGKAHQHLH